MKKLIIAVVAMLMFSGTAVADDPVIAVSAKSAAAAWVIIDGDVYFCSLSSSDVICQKAEMKD
jgi:hypothetical protein